MPPRACAQLQASWQLDGAHACFQGTCLRVVPGPPTYKSMVWFSHDGKQQRQQKQCATSARGRSFVSSPATNNCSCTLHAVFSHALVKAGHQRVAAPCESQAEPSFSASVDDLSKVGANSTTRSGRRMFLVRRVFKRERMVAKSLGDPCKRFTMASTLSSTSSAGDIASLSRLLRSKLNRPKRLGAPMGRIGATLNEREPLGIAFWASDQEQ